MPLPVLRYASIGSADENAGKHIGSGKAHAP
jgi:hypothetical protein